MATVHEIDIGGGGDGDAVKDKSHLGEHCHDFQLLIEPLESTSEDSALLKVQLSII